MATERSSDTGGSANFRCGTKCGRAALAAPSLFPSGFVITSVASSMITWDRDSFTFFIFHFLTAIRRFNLKKLMSNDVDCTTPNIFIVERWLRSGLSGALPVGPRLRVPTTAVTYLFTLQSFYFLSRCFDPMLHHLQTFGVGTLLSRVKF